MFEESTVVTFGSSVVLGISLLWYIYRRYRNEKQLGNRAVVKSLYVYPVKSCAGIKMDQVDIKDVGPLLDRAWVLVNSKGIYQNQISIPKLALVQTSFKYDKYLCLNAPGMPTLQLDIYITEAESREKTMVKVFSTFGEGLDCGDEAAEWFDKFLGKTGLRLYNGQNKNLKRRELKGDPIWYDAAKDGDKVIFSNAAPIFLASEESLIEVNKSLTCDPVDMRSFRPSIVIKDCDAFEEDTWNIVSIGNVILRKFKNCPRCPLITVDPDVGAQRNNKEPLETLKRTRAGVLQVKNVDKRLIDKPLFGVYFITDQPGTIHVGDNVNVLA